MNSSNSNDHYIAGLSRRSVLTAGAQTAAAVAYQAGRAPAASAEAAHGDPRGFVHTLPSDYRPGKGN